MAETQAVLPEPLLEISTLVERHHITINGNPYEIVNADELSIIDFHRIARKGEQVQALLLQDTDADEAQVKVLNDLLDSMCHVVLIAPEDIHALLSARHRLAIVRTFNQLHRFTAPAQAEGGEGEAPAVEVVPSTGESK